MAIELVTQPDTIHMFTQSAYWKGQEQLVTSLYDYLCTWGPHKTLQPDSLEDEPHYNLGKTYQARRQVRRQSDRGKVSIMQD